MTQTTAHPPHAPEAGPALTLPELVLSRAEADADRVALCMDGAEEITFGAWLDRSRAVARALGALGVRAGDRVGLLFPENGWIDYAVAALGVHLSGGVVLGLSPRLAPGEIRGRLRHCGATGVLCGERIAEPGFDGWAGSAGWVRRSRDLAAYGAGAAGRSAIDPKTWRAQTGPDDLAEIIYTSGTTGRAKPVAVTHANLTHGQDRTGGLLRPAGPGALAPVPLGTNAGHSAIMVALTGRSTVHVLSDPKPRAVAEALEGLRPALAILPAPLSGRLAGRRLLEGRDLAGLRSVMLGSAPVFGAVADYLRRLLPGAALSVGYGSTEAAPASLHHPIPAHGPLGAPGTLGRPGPGVAAQIRGEDGEPLPPGQVGEIWLKSAAAPRGYYAIPDGGTFRDGWTRMGDLGVADRDGTLTFFGRAADAVSVAGEPVCAFRIEDALRWHPQVADVAVVQAPDGRLVAAVELTGPDAPADLRPFLAERLAQHEVPDLILPVGSLPRGGLGKVLKRRLRESFTPKESEDD